MSGQFYLDWAGLALSLFNMILLVWLGFTTLLNAERRTLGLYIASTMLLSGGAFFLIHTIILGYGADLSSQSLNFWWQLGWFPVILLPYAWYGVMLWYAGYWEDIRSQIHTRHRYGLGVASGLLLSILIMLTLANPVPNLSQISQIDLTATPTLLGFPLLIVAFPSYLLVCLSLSLNVLMQPSPTSRFMRDQARRRARPWLIAATTVQVVVSLLVGWIMFWVISTSRQHLYENRFIRTISWFDMMIASLIVLAVILVGQAIVSYEVFTGKALPRRGLHLYWRRLLILAAGYSLLVSWVVSLPLRPIFSLLMSTLLMVTFYGLLSWRAYAERERYMESLRPFVTSQNLYNHFLGHDDEISGEVDLETPFQALTANLLGTRKAFLIPMGPIAALAGPALVYPIHATEELSTIQKNLPVSLSPDTLFAPMSPKSEGSATWAIPLWSARGLIGVLVLGEKHDGGLYTQEEIEIARTVAERLVDTQASANLARRLVGLQRQRLSEMRLLDEHTRRTLHDEVLPQLHAALLALNQDLTIQGTTRIEAAQTLSDVHRLVADMLHELPRSSAPEVKRLGLIGAIEALFENELKSSFDEVSFHASRQAESRARAIPQHVGEVLYYAAREALRNAARHARKPESDEALKIGVDIDWHDGIEISITDNGVGLHVLPNLPGSSHGLTLHSAMLAVFGGSLTLDSTGSSSTRAVLKLPEQAFHQAS